MIDLMTERLAIMQNNLGKINGRRINELDEHYERMSPAAQKLYRDRLDDMEDFIANILVGVPVPHCPDGEC